MERLELGAASTYDALEAAIHIGRYALVRELCRDRRVLDLACGQGYGSRLMRQWGARHVVGVDASTDAIERAKSLFSAEGIEFHCRDASQLSADELGQPFDLAVCIETIEHVADAAGLLRLLRNCVHPAGLIVVTCPNDHWYYPGEGEANAFHLRKYRFEEFRALAESELGPANWRLGTGLLGFVSMPLAGMAVANEATPQDAMLNTVKAGIQVVPAPMQLAPTAATSAFYVGVWGRDEATEVSGAAFPVSMDAVASAVSGRPDDRAMAARAAAVQADLRALAETIEPKLVRSAVLAAAGGQATEARSAMVVQALERENRLLRDRVAALDEANAAAAQLTAHVQMRANELLERVRAAEQLSDHWASALNAERERTGAIQLQLEQVRTELASHRLRLALVEQDRAAMQLRLDELEWVAPPSQTLTLSPPLVVPTVEPSRPPRLGYRIYRRAKSLVPAGLRQHLGPRISRWLPRP